MKTSNLKEMSYNELNTMIADLNKQMEKIRNKREKMISEIESRKEEAISNWKRHTAQLKEATKAVAQDSRILLGMGIDPYSLPSENDENLTEKEICQEVNLKKISERVSESDVPVKVITTEDETFVAEEENKPRLTDDRDKHISNEEDSTPTTTDEIEDDHNHPLLTPYYKLWNLKPIKKEKPVKKETIDRKHNPYTRKKMVNKLLTPYYKLFTDKPIKSGLKIGNLKFKKNYPDPEETRIISADGYAPTLTYTHSDFWIWIGPRYDENGEMISETPVGEDISMAA